MSQIALEKFERSQMRTDLPDFRPGDTIRVNFRVREGERERIQGFEGVCIRRSGGGHAETVTVRKISSGIGVERTFFLHSPMVESIKVQRRGHVRRARLYYLRKRFGKKARVRSSKKYLLRKQLANARNLEAAPPDAQSSSSQGGEGPAETEASRTEPGENVSAE